MGRIASFLTAAAVAVSGWLPGAGSPPATGPRAVADPALVLRFIDVDQADAVLITLGRQAVLVDAGRADNIILSLADYGVDSLVAAIASHNHDDHIGGMDAVVADIPIGRYFDNGRSPTNDNARAVETWLSRKQVARGPPPWDPLRLGDASVTVFPSNMDPARASENNSSLGVLVERGSFRALLTGDSEAEALNAWLRAGVIPEVTVLKAAHHGARNGVTPGWLLRTRPEVVVISVGAKNRYNHPDPTALRYYLAGNRKIYRTDLDGTVTITVDREGRYQVATSGPTER
ncbi:MAG: ComEC/Rec2 family competence protein [Gemmatimonadales bacterium]